MAAPASPSVKSAPSGRNTGIIAVEQPPIRAVLIEADTDRVITGMQLVTRRWDGKNGLILRLASLDEPPAGLSERLIEAVHEARPMYPQDVAAGTIHHLGVEWVGRDGLVTNPRTGKLVQVVDERMVTE